MDYDFSKIPEFNDSPESFDITADKVSGRIPVTRLEHWRELPGLLSSSFFNQEGVEPIFRGHRRYDWALMPTLARASEDEMISKELADKQLSRFKQAIRGRIKDHSLVEDNSDQENELWAVGQHHGLMTPLLDWTYSPYVALFFAFSKGDVDEEKSNDYRSLYILNKTFIESDKLCADIPVIEPKKDDHGRLVNQAGLFTFSPYKSTIEVKLLEAITKDKELNEKLLEAETVSDSEGNLIGDGQAAILAKYICKVYIKNEGREECVKYLRQMNVHHASLFPDLIGASEYCNVLISESKVTPKLELKEEPKISFSDLAKSAEYHPDDLDFASEDYSMAESEAHYTAIADNANEAFVGMLLHLHGKDISESTRDRIARLISDSLADNLLLDWKTRENIKAKARSSVRQILKKYDFPLARRDRFLNDLFSGLEKFDSENTTTETES